MVTLKRKSLAAMPTPHKKSKLSSCYAPCKSLWSSMVDSLDPDTKRSLTAIFMDLPDKSLYPDYYVIIKNPMAFNTILHHLESMGYDTVDEMIQDMELIFQNAQIYNAAGSMVYEDSVVLQKKLKKLVKSLQKDSVLQQPVIKLVQSQPDRPIIKIKTMDSDTSSLLKSIIAGQNTPLKQAITSSSFAVNQLVSDASSGNETKWSLLHAAAFHNNIEAVHMLLEAGAQTPLGWAAYKLNKDVCQVLIEHGADKKAKNIHQQTPYDLVDSSVREHPTWTRLFKENSSSKPLKLTVKLSATSTEQRDDEGLDIVDETMKTNGQESEKRNLESVHVVQDQVVVEEEEIEVESVTEPTPVETSAASTIQSTPLPHYPTPQQGFSIEQEPIAMPPAMKLLTSIGIVSNENLIRQVIPSCVFAHSLQVDSTIRNLNLRLLLVQGSKSRCILKHNGRVLKMTSGGTGDSSHIMDFSASLSPGMNSFEVVVMSGDYGLYNESYALFINKLAPV